MQANVGVIIPLYNGEDTIEKCLDSLIDQAYPFWRAVVIDDCSTDGGAQIVKGYAQKDDRIVFVQNQKNMGVSHTRNVGLEMLNLTYTAFLDCDDVWESNYLEKMMYEMEQSGADVVQCAFVYDFENGKRVYPKSAFKERTQLCGKGLRRVYRRMMTGINMNHVCMKLIKTELIKNLKFDTSLPTAEDLVFVVRMFEHVKKYVFLPDVLYHYSRSSTSITGSSLSGSEKIRCNKKAARVMLEQLGVWGIDTPFYRMLTRMRVYIIIASKTFRNLRERIVR